MDVTMVTGQSEGTVVSGNNSPLEDVQVKIDRCQGHRVSNVEKWLASMTVSSAVPHPTPGKQSPAREQLI